MGTLNDLDMDNLANEGSIVTYNMVITNKGNVRMSDTQVKYGTFFLARIDDRRESTSNTLTSSA